MQCAQPEEVAEARRFWLDRDVQVTSKFCGIGGMSIAFKFFMGTMQHRLQVEAPVHVHSYMESDLTCQEFLATLGPHNLFGDVEGMMDSSVLEIIEARQTKSADAV